MINEFDIDLFFVGLLLNIEDYVVLVSCSLQLQSISFIDQSHKQLYRGIIIRIRVLFVARLTPHK